MLPAQAFTSPGRYGQFEEPEDLSFTAEDICSVIASCHHLVTLHLDDILTHDPDDPDFDAPAVAPQHVYTCAQLKTIEAGCTKLEDFVVADDPKEPPGQPSRLIEIIPNHEDELPRLLQLMTAWEPAKDAVVSGYDLSEGTLMPFGWADHEEWVVSSCCAA